MNKFLNWLVFSSENPDNIALTVKGIALMAVPAVLTITSQFGLSVNETNIVAIISQTTTTLAAGLTVIGLIRKLINTFAGKKVVAFTVPAEKLSPTVAKKKVAIKKKK